ncbi:prepilin peptidase [Occallatibacter savannae]|uniref:prepilin peptidase n=1 Tax=Occallatibacter savannae TaxID=1002691 RepID=UPI0013A5776C|nr:A24 family peptidase [Occallatibacter savannae]
MIRVFCTVLAGLLGLAFGSFLNVCLSRWPEGESVVKPRSHCRSCRRTLTWWENVPVVSWVALRGKCRTCGAIISWRYPAVELAIGLLWATVVWQAGAASFEQFIVSEKPYAAVFSVLLKMSFLWLLVALAMLDAEHLWLPNWLTIPGVVLGLINVIVGMFSARRYSIVEPGLFIAAFDWAGGVIAAAGLILIIRWTYWLIRRREGIGLGDAKLMAMLGAWLGLSGALFCFGIGVVLGALFALTALALPASRRDSENWLAAKLPLGTFLCIGGIISALCGQPIIEAYKRWAGF